MKLLSFLLCAVTAVTLQADEPPETYIPSRYYDLWKNSPFTDPPPVEEKEEVKNDLEDWVLMGVRKYKDSQIVTVVNSKDRAQRVEIPSSDANELGFAILEVKMARSFLNTEVRLQKGPHRGWVQYDPKFLVVKRAVGPSKSSKTSSKQPPRPGSPTQSKPPVPGKSRTPSKSTGKPSPPSAPGSSPTTSSAGTKGTTTPAKKSRVRYVPRPK